MKTESLHASLIKNLAMFASFGAAFLIVSALAHQYEAPISDLVHSGGFFSVTGFIALTAIFVIFVIPLDIVFLIPIGASVWGPIPTALMSITGWTIGSAIAFLIARKLGVGVIEMLIGLDRVRAIESRIPKNNLFWGVVALRMLVSVDILSYALGLFSAVELPTYILATMIGVTPFGFYFAFSGALPFWYQFAAIAAAVGMAMFTFLKFGLSREP